MPTARSIARPIAVALGIIVIADVVLDGAFAAEPGSFVLRNDRGPRSLTALRQLLADARRQGFASEDGEVTAGFASVAVAAETLPTAPSS